MENLPIYIPVIFSLTAALAIGLFYQATNFSKVIIPGMVLWLILQSTLALSHFYTVTTTFPPRFAFLVLPPLLLIAALFATHWGRRYLAALNVKTLTLLHLVRIPVEVVLFWLAINHVVPTLMTFEGRNFDILAGLTAPLIYYFGYVKNLLPKKLLLAWNLICLGLLLNIVVNAILSVPTPLQQFAFNQPNVALLYFPFIWLPCVIVPLVLLAHLATIWQLVKLGKSVPVNRLNNNQKLTVI